MTTMPNMNTYVHTRTYLWRREGWMNPHRSGDPGMMSVCCLRYGRRVWASSYKRDHTTCTWTRLLCEETITTRHLRYEAARSNIFRAQDLRKEEAIYALCHAWRRLEGQYPIVWRRVCSQMKSLPTILEFYSYHGYHTTVIITPTTVVSLKVNWKHRVSRQPSRHLQEEERPSSRCCCLTFGISTSRIDWIVSCSSISFVVMSSL